MHPNQYPVYSARITITNNTGHRLATGTNLYVVQTAERNSPTESTSALLRVIGGQFKQPPLEDYSGVVEFRGSEHNEYESLGLVDWVSVETRGGLYDFMGVFSDKRLRGAIGQYLSAASGQKFDTGYGASGNAVGAAQGAWATWAGVGK